MYFSQAAVLLSTILAIDASPIPRGSIARDSGDSFSISSFYSAAFEKRQTIGTLKSQKRVNNVTKTAEVQTRSTNQGVVTLNRRQKKGAVSASSVKLGMRLRIMLIKY
jgi:hypothetical protein